MSKQLERLTVGGLFLGLLVGGMWVADRLWVHGSAFVVVVVLAWAVGFALEAFIEEGA